MTASHSSQHSVQLTADGELLEPISELLSPTTSHAWRIFKGVSILCLPLLATLLALFMYFHPDWIGLFVVVSLTAGIIRLWFPVRWKSWYVRLLETGRTPSKEKRGKTGLPSKSDRPANNQLADNHVQPLVEDLFLVYPRHKAVIVGTSRRLHKYASDGERNAAFIFVIPILACGSFIFLFFMWGFTQDFALRHIQVRHLAVIELGFFVMMSPYLLGVVFIIFALLTAIESELAFRFLKKNGQVVFGRIVEMLQGHNSNGKAMIRLRYCFLTPDGREINTVQQISARSIKWLPQEDAPVAVWFADDGHYKLL